MKASIKFREEQNPLFRAKVPLSILGCPFQSGIVAGESKELALNLGTFFDSGPSLRLAYRPNDSLNPFGLVFKTGIGHFGSPIDSPMSMSAEFNLVGTQKNPRFFIHFKPRFGDFSLKKSQSSDFVKGISKPRSIGSVSDDDVSLEVIDTPVMVKNGGGYSVENGLFSGEKIAVLPSGSEAGSLIGGLLSGVDATARTALPIMNRAVVNFRWGFRYPPAEGGTATVAAVKRRNTTAGISFQQFPLLVMNKIGIEHVVDDDSKDSKKVINLQGSDGVVETCLGVKKQLQIIQAENEMLRKAMDDLKSEFAAGKWVIPAGGSGGDLGGRVDRRSYGGKKASSEFSGFGGKAAEGDVDEELKKGSKEAAGA